MQTNQYQNWLEINKTYRFSKKPTQVRDTLPSDVTNQMNNEISDFQRKNSPNIELVGDIPVHAIHAAHSVFDVLPDNMKKVINEEGHKIVIANFANKDAIKKHIEPFENTEYADNIKSHMYGGFHSYPKENINRVLTQGNYRDKHEWIESPGMSAMPEKRIFITLPLGTPETIHQQIELVLGHELGHHMFARLYMGGNEKRKQKVFDIYQKMQQALGKEGLFSKDTQKGYKEYRYNEQQLPIENIAELTATFLRYRLNNKHIPFNDAISNFTTRLATKYPETTKVYKEFLDEIKDKDKDKPGIFQKLYRIFKRK